MDNNTLTEKLLSDSNFATLDASNFVKTYIEKLVYNILTYVNDKISLGTIEITDNYVAKNELSQNITGCPSAFSSVDGATSALIAFAEEYSHLGVTDLDMLCKEVIVDFLNLHNGLFVVKLSQDNICELSLDAPKQDGSYTIDNTTYKSITVIPIIFSYGTIKFLLCEIQ